MTDWPSILSDLMREQGISQRRLCLDAGVQRSTFRNFKLGKGGISIIQLERILAILGCELDAIPLPDANACTDMPVTERPAVKPARKRLISYAGAPC